MRRSLVCGRWYCRGLDRVRGRLCHHRWIGRSDRRQSDDGKWTDKDGNPTFKIEPDGTVDWYTYVGFTRYSSECLRCHGPDGMGSSYAPALIDSMKHLSYTDFYAHRRRRQKGCVRLAGPGDAGQRRQQERHVLHRRDLRLSARARRRCDRARPSGKARAEARCPSPRPRTNAWGDAECGRVMAGLRQALESARSAHRCAIVLLRLSLASARSAQAPGLGSSAELVDPKAFRVCADPHDLPFSNEAGEGFENKLAELFARNSASRPATPIIRR